ncbi:tyrosine-protein kinase family protein [Pseudothauera nasutitermitis]|uniref:non-specific protein-tyrosine kinase n=1 Tax=Pseudothauera nasutitermitis TaxID=2565930 RepID=A0A4S4AWM2_9RHOO|nr:XrtA-associated tyrosine autokinase [Pseudothauera nasutitermitis]THF63665.1 tyrosine-protein kinase family protein [Pseudothauera nasutitermitis]
MSLIEKAAERLEKLREAGALPAGNTDTPAAVPAPAVRSPAVPPAAPAPAAGAAPQASARTVRIDLAGLARDGMVTPDLPRTPIAEEYRVIKRPLLRNLQGKGAAAVDNGNLIMVSSALPGEGKSFTAINLAISIAMELDHTVLLVDADVSRPSVLQRLGLPPEKGLMDVLTGGAELGEVLLRTNVDKLTLLPAGRTHQRATELLASDAMIALLEEMATRYAERVIVFDSPPLLVTTEARELATHMGQVVLVVEANRTTHATVKQALATIENCPVKLMVLNKAAERGPAGYYGYSYGYGHGHGNEAHPDAA